jgi:para-aminobenzoate synthetase / 4-amino-4-deoxychorismate lyase
VTPFDVMLRTPRHGPWRTFHSPVAVLRALTPDEVGECLAAVDQAVGRGGYAAGFITYEAAAAFGLPAHPRPATALPLVSFGIFPPEHVGSATRPRQNGAYRLGPWRPSIDRAAYAAGIHRIKALIEEGVTHQINFTFRLDAAFEGDPLSLLTDLDAAQAGPWGAYVDAGRYVICSASPELFFRVEGDMIEGRPMKGTAPRGLWAAADRLQAERLRASEKNRAENVRVVDMVRNDLGRLAETGSVEVVSLFDVERYPLQWQMTSTVRARASQARLAQLVEAMFPPGSVTGTPKHRAMQIIRDLESRPRGVSTGVIGYLSPNGRGHFSVATGSIVIDREHDAAEVGVGGGIVLDSVDDQEYDECLLRASILLPAGPTRSGSPDAGRPGAPPVSYVIGSRPDFGLLETIGWTPGAGFALLGRHLDRLRDSAACFGFECDIAEVRAVLEAAVEDLPGAARVRLLVSHDGSIACEAIDAAPAIGRPLRAAVAADPIDAADVFLYHKTTRRRIYERARASRPDVDTVLLWNGAREVTEATDWNVVVQFDGQKVTPPVECGLLGGTLRADLLQSGEIAERRILVDELRAAERIWLINSVRGWVAAELVDGRRAL